MGFKIKQVYLAKQEMKTNTKQKSFIQNKINKMCLFLKGSKIFWKEVAENYKKINSVL